MKLSSTKKQIIIGILLVILGASFIPLFEDPFHEKDYLICFWEWLYKEVHEIIYGEKEVNA